MRQTRAQESDCSASGEASFPTLKYHQTNSKAAICLLTGGHENQNPGFFAVMGGKNEENTRGGNTLSASLTESYYIF